MKRLTTIACLVSACASSSAQAPDEGEPPPAPQAGAAGAKKRLPVGPRAMGGGAAASGAPNELDKAKKLARDGDAEGAIRAARAALEQDPSLEEAYLLIGSVCGLLRNFDCANAAYLDGIRASPSSAAIHHALGMLLLETERVDQAIASLEAANKLAERKSADVAADLAYAYIFVERFDDALTLAATARALDPKSFAAAFTHGSVLLKIEKIPESIEALEAALAIVPNEPSASRTLARALAKAGQNQRALDLYQAMLAGGAKDPRVYAASAGLLLELGRPKDAVAAMKNAVALEPENPKLLELLAHAQEQAGDKPGAKATRKRLAAPARNPK